MVTPESYCKTAGKLEELREGGIQAVSYREMYIMKRREVYLVLYIKDLAFLAG